MRAYAKKRLGEALKHRNPVKHHVEEDAASGVVHVGLSSAKTGEKFRLEFEREYGAGVW